MEKVHRQFLRTQFICSGTANAILNALFFYLGNREMKPLAYPDAAVDAFITCGFMSLLVTLPTAFFTGKALRSGMPPMAQIRWLDWLPRRKWRLWLLFWLGAAIVMETVFAGIYFSVNWGTIEFSPMLWWRFCWCGVLGGGFGALAGARFLQPSYTQLG